MNSSAIHAAFERRVGNLEGKTAIFIEKTVIWRIAVSRVSTDAMGFSATAIPIDTHGLHRGDGKNGWTFGASWNLLSGSDTHFVHDDGWQLYVDPLVEKAILKILANLPAGRTYLDDFTPRKAPDKSKFVAINSPGPVARRVYEFVRRLALYPPAPALPSDQEIMFVEQHKNDA